MYIDKTVDPSVVEKSFNKCIMHYRLPRDIQGHANKIKQTTDRVAKNLGETKEGQVLAEIGVGEQWGWDEGKWGKEIIECMATGEAEQRKQIEKEGWG